MRKTVLGDRLYRGVTEEGSGSLKNQVRAREGRLQSLMEELEGKKGEIVDLNTQLEEAKQQVVLQQERQNQFVTTERAKADRMAEKLERSEAERRAEVNELNLYYQQAVAGGDQVVE
ncbi:hypothetical protein Pmar_PMAR002009 [Perkinsus marinus ATCC 50983]|uniref:Uncharacterized protein n=1 Tax=Perkinsus marinus (strain ATCC 50983 / TXsc) TaxID=423536 RepID=C5LYF3_PERM5|nr:hypothetical protein Pmar_PMAR002009 [Perkinsus marinus ATCC 50983]EEQ98191.1 hypothetical protein Pmar_PMAR002009 [Perkinsus marinus ATCC 50983]|eukprot:XP_002765474.1 hypothetical protein Pmar_PMAR002009 [Perkinsus marinus ATCC 50983]